MNKLAKARQRVLPVWMAVSIVYERNSQKHTMFLCWTEHTWIFATSRTTNSILQIISWHWCDERDTE